MHQLWAKARNPNCLVSLYLGNDISAVGYIGLEIANGVHRPLCTSVTQLKNCEFRADSNTLLTSFRFAEKRIAQGAGSTGDVVGENGYERLKIKKPAQIEPVFPLKPHGQTLT